MIKYYYITIILIQINLYENVLPKFGGMIANGFDDLGSNKKKLKVYNNCLSFSHGRSAMIWLVENDNFNSYLLCNILGLQFLN